MLLTPLIVRIWTTLAPPSLGQPGQLSPDAWRRGEALTAEAAVVTVLAGVLFGVFLGFGTVLDGPLTAIILSGIPGIPTAWVLLRCGVLGSKDAIADFGRYFEQKNGISFRSWLCIGIPAFAVCMSFLIALLASRKRF